MEKETSDWRRSGRHQTSGDRRSDRFPGAFSGGCRDPYHAVVAGPQAARTHGRKRLSARPTKLPDNPAGQRRASDDSGVAASAGKYRTPDLALSIMSE